MEQVRQGAALEDLSRAIYEDRLSGNLKVRKERKKGVKDPSLPVSGLCWEEGSSAVKTGKEDLPETSAVRDILTTPLAKVEKHQVDSRNNPTTLSKDGNQIPQEKGLNTSSVVRSLADAVKSTETSHSNMASPDSDSEDQVKSRGQEM